MAINDDVKIKNRFSSPTRKSSLTIECPPISANAYICSPKKSPILEYSDLTVYNPIYFSSLTTAIASAYNSNSHESSPLSPARVMVYHGQTVPHITSHIHSHIHFYAHLLIFTFMLISMLIFMLIFMRTHSLKLFHISPDHVCSHVFFMFRFSPSPHVFFIDSFHVSFFHVYFHTFYRRFIFCFYFHPQNFLLPYTNVLKMIKSIPALTMYFHRIISHVCQYVNITNTSFLMHTFVTLNQKILL